MPIKKSAMKDIPDSTKKIVEHMHQEMDKMIELFIRKNNDYSGENHAADNISLLGLEGVFVRMFDKIMRLKTLVWDKRQQKVTDESIEDTLRDTAVYALIALTVLHGKWK